MPKAQLAMLLTPDKRAATRRIVNIGAQLRGIDARVMEVEMLDLTTDGFKAEVGQPLAAEASGWLRLPGLPPANCQVIWSDGDNAGFKFTSPLHPASVEAIVVLNRRPIRKGHFGMQAGARSR